MKNYLFLLFVGLVNAIENFFSGDDLLDLANQGDGALGTESGRFTLFAESAITTRYLMVTKGTADNEIAVCGLNSIPIGVCEDEPAAGDPASVHGIGLGGGSMTCVASKAIAVGDEVFTAASGKVTDTSATNAYSVGFALTAAAADGDRLQIAPNLKIDKES